MGPKMASKFSSRLEGIAYAPCFNASRYRRNSVGRERASHMVKMQDWP